jgi:tRNA-dihydrouridine synthase A
VTVKTRIGVDEHDDYGILRGLTTAVVDAGASALIVHARKAWLSGLSPKQNREIPALDYARVYRLKTEFPELPIEINGGFTTEADVLAQAGKVDGVMLGRAAYNDPMLVARLDRQLHGGAATDVPTVPELLAGFASYMQREQDRGTSLRAMSRHLMGLFREQPGARRCRRRLGELMQADTSVDDLIAELTGMPTVTRYNAGSAGRSAT